MSTSGMDAYMAGTPTTYGRLPHWIPDLWSYYDEVGELHYNASFLANAMSRCTLRLGVLDKDNRRGPAFEEDGKPVEGIDGALAELAAKLIGQLRATPAPGTTFQGPVGGQQILLARMGHNLGSVAECYLLGWQLRGGSTFEVVSSLEIQPIETKPGEKQKFRRRRTRQTGFEEITPDFYLRIYRSHPAYSGEPDSANRPMANTLERLKLLGEEGVADSKSRLAGPGVYWVPSEIDFPGDDEDPEGDDYLTTEFIETASTAIRAQDAASRYVPIVMRGPGEWLDKIRHDKFDLEKRELEAKRAAAVSDYARGGDFPIEVTVGFGETTFANAFAVTEATSRLHVEPWLDVVVGCLTGGYLTPALMKSKRLTAQIPPPEIAQLVVWYDVSGLVSHANPEKVAAAGYGTAANPNFLISEAAWRRLNGIPEADRPSDEEIARRLEWAHKLRMRSEVGGAKDNTTSEPEPTDDSIRDDGGDTDEEIGKRVMSLADYVIRRSVDRHGAWVRSRCQGNKELSQRVNGVDNADVARVLGPQVVENLGSHNGLLGGELSTFERTVRDMLVEAGRADASDVAEAALHMVTEALAKAIYQRSGKLTAAQAQGFLTALLRD